MLSRRSLLATAMATVAAPHIARAQDAATLRYVPQSSLSVLDPVFTTGKITTNHGYHVFDTLYAVDSQYRPQPQMAEGHEVSADGREWRIRLRPGLRFHDGEPVRAADCVASLSRWSQRDGLGLVLKARLDSMTASDDRTHPDQARQALPGAAGRAGEAGRVRPIHLPRASREDAGDRAGQGSGRLRPLSLPSGRIRDRQPSRL
jgi:peptide/nickel transport system substrate-binding protein